MLNVIPTVKDETNANENLKNQTTEDKRYAEVVVRMSLVRLKNIAELVRVCGEKCQVHHALSESPKTNNFFNPSFVSKTEITFCAGKR